MLVGLCVIGWVTSDLVREHPVVSAATELTAQVRIVRRSARHRFYALPVWGHNIRGKVCTFLLPRWRTLRPRSNPVLSPDLSILRFLTSVILFIVIVLLLVGRDYRSVITRQFATCSAAHTSVHCLLLHRTLFRRNC